MKNSVLSLVFIFIFGISVQSKNIPTVYEQLCTINKAWTNNSAEFPILSETILLKNDQSLIQLHLRLVEIALRTKSVLHLSSDQQTKRNQALDILHNYWQRAIFPINIYHTERTPYFIDHLGTACAVGHIVIETGYADFAKQIQTENNYRSIYELAKLYPLLNDWAIAHGFSMDELAWIQPYYGSCWGSGVATNPTCHDFCDGSVELEIPVGSTPPYSVSGPPCGNLCAGTYTYIITDSNGSTYAQTYTLVDPAPVDATITLISNATSHTSCEGNLVASSSGGTAPFTYYWFDCDDSPLGVNSQNIDSLCPGEYYVVINDFNGCSDVSSCVAVGNLSGLEENPSNLNYSLFPNPTNETLTISIEGTIENSYIHIMDLSGRTILWIEAKNDNTLNLLDLKIESGSYIVQIENKDVSKIEKIIFVK